MVLRALKNELFLCHSKVKELIGLGKKITGKNLKLVCILAYLCRKGYSALLEAKSPLVSRWCYNNQTEV